MLNALRGFGGAMSLLGYSLLFGLLILSGYLLIVGQSILLPFVIAVFFWYLINALAESIRRAPVFSKPPSDVVCFSASILVFLGLFWALIELIASNVSKVVKAAPTYQENLNRLLQKILDLVGLEEVPSLARLTQDINVPGLISDLVAPLTGVAGSAITILLYVIFLLLEERTFPNKLKALVKDEKKQAMVRETTDRIAEDIRRYLWVKTLTSGLTGVVSFVVMLLVGVDYAGFWAVLIFVLNFIPYIGSLLGVVFPSVLAIIQFDTFGPFFTTLIALTSVQVAVGNVIEPKIMGKSLNLSPVVMLLGLAIWGSVWGVAGMFLSVPIMVIAMIVLGHFPQTRPIAILMSENGDLNAGRPEKA